MSKRALLIGENISSFILNAIQESLTAESYEVHVAPPKVNELGCLDKKPDVIVIYAGEYIDSCANAIVYLKDYCVEQEKKMCLIGYTDEIEALKKIIPSNIIWNAFERPLNVKELVVALN